MIRFDFTPPYSICVSSYVYQGRDRVSGQTVALKKLLIYKESAGVTPASMTPPTYFSYLMYPQFPLCAIREIKFLNSLKHPNVVHLREVVTSKGCEELGDAHVPCKHHFIHA